MDDPRAQFQLYRHANVNHLVRLANDPEFYHPLYDASWLSVCDSRILEGLAQLSGLPLYAVPGSDLSQQLFENVITAQDPITVIGADREIVNRVKARYGLTKVNHHIPPMGLRNKPDAIADCARYVAENPVRYVFICVGSSQQELVAKACLDRGDCVGLGLCVGACSTLLVGVFLASPNGCRKLGWNGSIVLGRSLSGSGSTIWLWVRRYSGSG